MASISTFTTSGAPSSGRNEVQTLTYGGTITGGSHTLKFGGQTTAAIVWSSTNATLLANVLAALEALSTIEAGNVSVTAGSLTAGIGTVLIEFQADLGKKDVGPITVVSDDLQGTAPTVAVTTTTAGVTGTERGAAKASLLGDITTGIVYAGLGTTTAPVWVPVAQSMRTASAKTANYTVLTPEDNGKNFTTEGAGGAVTFSLPAATVGQWYRFNVLAAQELRIDPYLTETIGLPSTGVQQAAGKYLTANAAGEAVEIECIKAGQWQVRSYIGTWEAEG